MVNAKDTHCQAEAFLISNSQMHQTGTLACKQSSFESIYGPNYFHDSSTICLWPVKLGVTSEIAFQIVKYQAWELFANNQFEGEIVNSAL